MKIYWSFIKYYKVFQSLHFMPLTWKSNFAIYTWNNWAGKSSILQALDSYFNNINWYINNNGSARWRDEQCTVSLLFSLTEIEIDEHFSGHIEEIKTIWRIIWTLAVWETETIAWQSNLSPVQNIIEQKLKAKTFIWNNNTDEFIFCISSKYSENRTNTAWFDPFGNDIERISEIETEILDNIANELYNYLKQKITYLYIPTEISPQDFLKFDSQKLMSIADQGLYEAVDHSLEQRFRITRRTNGRPTEKSTLQLVNESLSSFISSFQERIRAWDRLITLNYPARKRNLTTQDLRNIILESYFYTKFFQVNGINIGELSSWEQKKAILNICYGLLTDNNSGKFIIFAVDEPENSQHISNMLEPFNKILQLLNNSKVFCLVTTHWYWALAMLENWYLHYIEKNIRIECSTFNLYNYQEDRRSFPEDLYFKSFFDLAANIISTLRIWQSWIICEWSDDKVYLTKHLSDWIDKKILCVGWRGNVLKLYKLLYSALDWDSLTWISWKVFCIVDTDHEHASLDNHYLRNIPNLCIRRFQKNSTLTEITLINLWPSWVISPTTIEYALEPKAYYNAVKDALLEKWMINLFDHLLFNENSVISMIEWDHSIIVSDNQISMSEFLVNKRTIIEEINNLEIKYLIAQKYNPEKISDLNRAEEIDLFINWN